MLNKGKVAAVACVLSLGVAGKAGAQAALKYGTCADVTQANFTKVIVADKTKDPNMDEVIRFGVSKNGTVIYAERAGGLKEVKPDGSVVKLGKVNVYPPTSPLKGTRTDGGNINNEFGLVGLALDPDFDNTHMLYVEYQSNDVSESRLSRFTVASDVLDMASEKILLHWPIQQNYCCHTGGDMRIDSKGDLWATIGNNTMNPASDKADNGYVDETSPDKDDGAHAANSNDLRGKIIRIHPTADGAYTVPAGNFKDYFASMYSAADLAKIKPEIYTMGDRNPYTIAVDDVTGWLAWGEVGPDTQQPTEEYNLMTHPGFMGWPYFAGAVGNVAYSFKLNKDPAAPTNNSPNNTGVTKLPPATGAIIGYQEGCAVTGPLYHWSAAQTSTKKLPGQFDGKWFVTDWLHNDGIKVVTPDNTGTKITANVTFFANNWASYPLELYVAPDGVLYLLEYNSSYRFAAKGVTPTEPTGGATMRISRLEYTGAPCAVTVSVKDQMAVKNEMGKTSLVDLGMFGSRSVNMAFGAKGLRMYDLQGKLAWQYTAASAASTYGQKVSVPASVGNGVYRVKFEF